MHEDICRRIELRMMELKELVLEGINKADVLTHEQMEIIDLQGQRYHQLYTQYHALKRIIDGNDTTS